MTQGTNFMLQAVILCKAQYVREQRKCRRQISDKKYRALKKRFHVPLLLNYFHDFLIVVLILIITFVTYILMYVTFNPYIDKYTMDSHFLETV